MKVPRNDPNEHAPNKDTEIYVRIVANHALELYEDPDGLRPLALNKARLVKSGRKLVFRFIANQNYGHHWPSFPNPPKPGEQPYIETAALVVIGQTEQNAADELIPGTPFVGGLGGGRTHYFPDRDVGEGGNLRGVVKLDGKNFIEAGRVKYKTIRGKKHKGPFKWALVALCDGGASYCEIDPHDELDP